ncbi:hypothetical protein FGO68_gene335 [Halteria grandinella]|uniref:Uncharacterized protein n=1 Tax=Halteria grandinella TaxID=5974 RepID=A0A8J8NNW5_HALGN|nr:hypothetical protein FGO68_gene335 [Halteria grandinella]
MSSSFPSKRLPVIVQPHFRVPPTPNEVRTYEQDNYIRDQNKMRNNLKHMKSRIDNKRPKFFNGSPGHTGKKAQLEEDRFTAIEKENVMLYSKIKDIIRKPTRLLSNNNSNNQSQLYQRSVSSIGGNSSILNKPSENQILISQHYQDPNSLSPLNTLPSTQTSFHKRAYSTLKPPTFHPRRPLKTLEDQKRLKDTNARLFWRLIKQGPTIDFNKFEKENQHKNQILRTITRFPGGAAMDTLPIPSRKREAYTRTQLGTPSRPSFEIPPRKSPQSPSSHSLYFQNPSRSNIQRVRPRGDSMFYGNKTQQQLLEFATNSSFEAPNNLSIEDESIAALLEDEPGKPILPQNVEIQGMEGTIKALQFMTRRPSPINVMGSSVGFGNVFKKQKIPQYTQFHL